MTIRRDPFHFGLTNLDPYHDKKSGKIMKNSPQNHYEPCWVEILCVQGEKVKETGADNLALHNLSTQLDVAEEAQTQLSQVNS